jgi:hypothetical protein
MNTTRVELVEAARWRELVKLFSDYNYRQVWPFGCACAQRSGATSEHVAVVCGEEVLALADVRIKRTPLSYTGIAYINGGPLVRRGPEGDPQRLRSVLEELRCTFVQRRGLLLRIAPSPGPPAWNEQQEQIYDSLGFAQAANTPRNRTIVVDLAPAPEALRKALDAKWRNHLNQAERSGLELRSGRDSGIFAAFCELHRQLVDRKGFTVDLDAPFYARVQEEMHEEDKFEITLAEMAGQPVAGYVTTLHGDTAVYLLGASTDLGRTARASFMLQWQSLLRARARGLRWYDLGGVDPQANPGVYVFKRSLGGLELTVAGPFEASPGEFRRLIVSGGERVYRAVRSRLRAARPAGRQSRVKEHS